MNIEQLNREHQQNKTDLDKAISKLNPAQMKKLKMFLGVNS